MLDFEENREVIIYSEDEFHRRGNFELLFPLKENIVYYKKFVENPGKENLLMWKWIMEDRPFDLLKSKKVFNEII